MRAREKQRFRTGEVGDIRVALAREHRIAAQPLLLGALDLAVPIGAFDEAHGNHFASVPREILEPAQHSPRRVFDKPAPRGRGRGSRASLPLRNTRSNIASDSSSRSASSASIVKATPALAARCSELVQPARELAQLALVLGEFIAGRQRRQLHGDARQILKIVAPRGFSRAHGCNRMAIGIEITLGIRGRQGRFAEHIERVAVLGRACRALQRVFDRLAHHELLPQDLHRLL